MKKWMFLWLISLFLIVPGVLAAPCTQDEITSSCECGSQTYSSGYCCDRNNGDNGVYFDSYYGEIQNGCPSGDFYYVSNSGNDGNTGLTPAEAWEHVDTASQVAGPGDAVIYLGGDYTESNGIECAHGRNCGTLYPRNNGLPNSYIVFKGHPDHPTPIMRGDNFQNYGPYLTGKSYLVIDNVEITETFRGIYAAGGSHNIVVKNSTVHDTSSPSAAEQESNNGGVFFGYTGSAHNMTAKGNTFYRNLRSDGSGGIIGDINTGGVWMYRCYDCLIEENHIYDQPGGYGIRMKLYDQRTTVRNNIIHDIGAVGIEQGQGGGGAKVYGNIIYDVGSHGMSIGTPGNRYLVPTYNLSIWNNVIYDCGSGITTSDVEAGPVNYTSHMKIYNNIISEIIGNPVDYGEKENLCFIDLNNLGMKSDYNLLFDDFESTVAYYDDPVLLTLSQYQSVSGKDLNSINQDPMFVDPANGDFRLQAGSPAIDAGIIVEEIHCYYSDEQASILGITQEDCKHWNGLAPDIGPYEFVPASTDIPPIVRNIECFDGTSWRDCETLVYGDSVEQIRAECLSLEDSVSSVNFRMEGLFDNYEYFNSGYTSLNGDVYTLDNTDFVIEDSGKFTIRVTCQDSQGIDFWREKEWHINWGQFTAQQISPVGSFNVNQGESFTYTTRLICNGGECGDVNATLDPLLSSHRPAKASSVADTEFAPRNAFDGIVHSNHHYRSAYNADPNQWIQVDLEDLYFIDSVDIFWNIDGIDKHAVQYEVQVSQDALSWETVYQETNGGGGEVESISFAPVLGRYLRIFMHQYEPGGTFYQIPLIEVYGTETAKGVVPVGSGTPFYTNINPQQCLDMKKGDSCDLTWQVTATGTSGANHIFFVIFESIEDLIFKDEFDFVDKEISPLVNVTIGEGTPCTLPYDEPTCGCIDSADLAESITGWFSGVIDISELLGNIKSWKTCT